MRHSTFAESGMSAFDLDVRLDELRRLAVERPREARAVIDRLLDARPPMLKALLNQISEPAESRLRQLISNSIRVDPRRRETVPQIEDWLRLETDEFTKNALRGALAASASPLPATPRGPKPIDPAYVEAYRYAAGRLMHRIRNALTEPQAILLKLVRSVDDDTFQARDALSRLATNLEESFATVARIVEFDTDDSFFALRPMSIIDWLQTMNVAYAKKFEPIDLTIDVTPDVTKMRIMASNYLLDTVFWNLWINAQQSVSDRCYITAIAKVESSSVVLVLLDNGDGFSLEAKDSAFNSRYSTKGKSRGRGLLEVQDAMDQMRGEIRFVTVPDRGSRLRLAFPATRAP